jgi:hypothetical protein
MKGELISSDWTTLSKCAAPPVFGGMAILLLVQMLIHPHQSNSGDYLFAIVWCTAALVVCWYGLRLKHIRIEGHTLYVSNYFKEIALPLTCIIGVKERVIAPNIRPVFIYLCEPSPFGQVIMFEPPPTYISLRHSAAYGRLRKIVNDNMRVRACE